LLRVLYGRMKVLVSTVALLLCLQSALGFLRAASPTTQRRLGVVLAEGGRLNNKIDLASPKVREVTNGATGVGSGITSWR
jgi:hypothetical protein